MIWYNLPPDLLLVDDRLDNWGRWARNRPKYSTARSAEGRYRHERGDQEDRRRPSLPVNAFDASLVDMSLAPAGGFPRVFCQILTMHYVHQIADRTIRKVMAIHVSEFEPIARKALYAANSRLARSEIVR